MSSRARRRACRTAAPCTRSSRRRTSRRQPPAASPEASPSARTLPSGAERQRGRAPGLRGYGGSGSWKASRVDPADSRRPALGRRPASRTYDDRAKTPPRRFDYSPRRARARSWRLGRCANQPEHVTAVAGLRCGARPGGRCASSMLAGAAMAADPGENAARRVLDRRVELRPAILLGCRVRQHHRQHLRHDADLRLPRATGEARAANARSDARGERRRFDLHVQVQEGNLLHARSRVRRQAARVGRRRSGVCDPATARSRGEESLAVAGRGQDRRRRRGARARVEVRQVRLRRPDCRPRSRRSLYAAHPPDAAGPALPVRVRGAEHGARRTRGRRRVRRRHRRAPGRHRTVHARRVQAELEDRAGREPRLPRDDVRCRPARFPPTRRKIAAALKGRKLPIRGAHRECR